MSQTPEPDYASLLKRSLATIEELEAKLASAGRDDREGIAVVGVGCRFPGGGDGPDRFWDALADGVDAVREVPPERFDPDPTYNPDPDAAGKTYTKAGAFLDEVDTFDPQFFGI